MHLLLYHYYDRPPPWCIWWVPNKFGARSFAVVVCSVGQEDAAL